MGKEVSIQYPSNASADTKWLMDEVNAILERNRQRGNADWCGYDYDFTCPSFVTYPFSMVLGFLLSRNISKPRGCSKR